MNKRIFVSVLALGVILPLIASAAWWPFSMIGKRGGNGIKETPKIENRNGLKSDDKIRTGAEISIECVAKLIDTRESGFASAWTTYATAESTALATRRTDLVSAWKLSDVKARNTAIQTAGSNYTKAHKLAAQDYRDSIKTAQVAYETTKKTCKILPVNDVKEVVPTPVVN